MYVLFVIGHFNVTHVNHSQFDSHMSNLFQKKYIKKPPFLLAIIDWAGICVFALPLLHVLISHHAV